MMNKIIKIGLVSGLVILSVLITGIIPSSKATENRVYIDCGTIAIDTQPDPDTITITPKNNFNIDVGSGATVYVTVHYTINCPVWDDNGLAKIWFVDTPGNSDQKQTGTYEAGDLTIHQYYGPNTEFQVGLYGKIWYNYGGQGSEDTKYSHDSTKPYTPPPNHAPLKPSAPSGPAQITVGTPGTWSSSAVDPDGDDIEMIFYWGDGSNSGWSSPVSSGSTVYADHTYMDQGTYSIYCYARDVPGYLMSPQSDHSTVICPLPIPH